MGGPRLMRSDVGREMRPSRRGRLAAVEPARAESSRGLAVLVAMATFVLVDVRSLIRGSITAVIRDLLPTVRSAAGVEAFVLAAWTVIDSEDR